MRRFSAAYLERTREGMWADSRAALADLDLPNRQRVLDVGCGTGELTRVLASESDAEVVGVDADRRLLDVANDHVPTVAGDALRLPFADDSVDLVVCQALLINLPEPAAALREFARVSTDLVAAIEPNNAAVSVDSTVDSEVDLEARVREAYLRGVDTDVALGEQVEALFAEAGIEPLSTRQYDHEKRIEPPYSEDALRSAKRKASGEGLADHEVEIRCGLDDEATYDTLRRAWREMGREVIDQMQDESYERVETVPFTVTVGQVQTNDEIE
ncbi:class I SAM-dependent methyltransferase [Halonotius terrestris]|uniref:Class I SAM-dependent methyltransferase n=1 Tax=Halonotius terrestris TaxID=2487750 RepID=A0A8J8PEA1_9EURY|nr:class I SAM-dependent methyltransferase [Halonotius terrestris]TQQ83705.1 class I SAM-dependent methyltransferase [Halonotius terrestris]